MENEVCKLRKPIDLTNQTFGYLTVIKMFSKIKGVTKWTCKCVCGKLHNVTRDQLVSGGTKSCGCKRKELMKENLLIERSKTRLSKSPTYKSWLMMKSRCDNPNYTHFEYYGGRGIAYDPRWKNFDAFLEDMGERPKTGTLDRKDPEGNYSKDNCRWVSRHEQVKNRRNTVKLTFDGITKTLNEWADLIGVDRKKIYGYMYRHNIHDIGKFFNTFRLVGMVRYKLRVG